MDRADIIARLKLRTQLGQYDLFQEQFELIIMQVEFKLKRSLEQ